MQNNNRIRIGNQTAFMAASPLEPFYYAVENGFDAFEWFPDKKETGAGWEIQDIPEDTRREIRETARSHDILLTVHTPWWASPLIPEADTLFRDQILFAGNIGASLVNLHLSIESGIEQYAEALTPVIKATYAVGLKLSVENTPATPPEAFNRLFAWWRDKKELPTGHVGMCLDLGHANLCETTRNDYVRYIDELGAHVPIIHMHLHENYGDYDSHLPIFTGPAGQNDTGVRLTMERLVRRGFSGAIILEQWPEPHTLLCDGRARLLDIVNRFQPQEKKELQAPVAAPPSEMAEPAREERKQEPVKPPEKPVAAKKPAPRKKTSKHWAFKSLVKMNSERRSWREKLDGVLTLLADEAFEPSWENLIYLAIYLRFLGTGEISTTEDGRHYRPSHHAKMAQQIIEKLTAVTTEENAFIMRKIYPWLPSYESQFMRAEPLTRIRDIAHRNDIPKELKREIKHSLQNKLHRCAGPEDLDTSAALLKRITAKEARYPAAFVEQFKIFHEELKEFFNAGSLEMRLEKFINDKELGGPVKRFLAAKKGLENDPGQQLATLSLATDLRGLLLDKAGNEPDAQAQNMRLADIGLEDYEFVLLSELITNVENSKKVPWELSLKTLLLILANLKLSGILPELSAAIASGLQTFVNGFDPAGRESLLKLKAALARCLRLTETYSDLVLSNFFEKVEFLGRELGIDEHPIKLYCEGDIRGNLIFQVSRLAALLIKKIRDAAVLAPWDVIVAGTVKGRLVTAKNLGGLKVAAGEELLVLLDEAEGDETVPRGVAGIILAHDLPHLSHLAIRTRQDGLVLIAGEDSEKINELKKLKGKSLLIKATAEAISFELATGKSPQKIKKKKPLLIPQVEFITNPPVLELEQVSLTNGGAKAYGAQLLRTLARRPDVGFNTPRGAVIPFGVMEEALAEAAETKARYDKLVKGLAALSGSGFIKTVHDLAALVSTLSVPEKVVKSITAKFPQNVRLMVRSSSNSEDLETMAGAGLYESVANVPPDNVEEAVRKVWASLWTERAALSRKQAEIPQDAVHMAVLVQQMIDPDYSFIMHTVNPITKKKNEVYVEMAVGLGETLASASIRGTPYRMVVDKKTGTVNMLAFADFSVALRPGREGGVTTATIDYSKVPLTVDEETRQRFGKQLAAIARFVEQAYGHPQDIEGAVVGEAVVLFQARPQQGIK